MPQTEDTITPVISFVIPCYNEEKFIARSISAIQSVFHNSIAYEIIVIDNGSTDATNDLVRNAGIEPVTIQRDSISHARNTGAELARAEIITFIDADVVITENWKTCFQAHIDSFNDNPLFLAGHQYITRPNGTWIERHWFSNLKDKLLNGGNIITSRTCLSKIGGFDVNLKTGEDYDLCIRAIEAGVTYIDDPGFEAIHEGFPRDLGHFIRREIWHGEGDFYSFETFIKSPVAVLGTGYILYFPAAIFSIIYFPLLASILTTGIVAGNAAITWRRFRGSNPGSFIPNMALNFIYFFARGLSIFKALKNRKKAY